jgi:hypothetical protein
MHMNIVEDLALVDMHINSYNVYLTCDVYLTYIFIMIWIYHLCT